MIAIEIFDVRTFNATVSECFKVLEEFQKEISIKYPNVSLTYTEGNNEGAFSYDFLEEKPLGTPDIIYARVKIYLDIPETSNQIKVFFYVCSENAREFVRNLNDYVVKRLPGYESIKEELTPWQQIPDRGHDRMIVQLLYKGYMVKTIAFKVGISPKTVSNRLSILRNIRGSEIPYTENQRWREKHKKREMKGKKGN